MEKHLERVGKKLTKTSNTIKRGLNTRQILYLKVRINPYVIAYLHSNNTNNNNNNLYHEIYNYKIYMSSPGRGYITIFHMNGYDKNGLKILQ